MKKIEKKFWAIVSCISYSSDTRAIITQQNTLLCNYLYLPALEALTVCSLLGKPCNHQDYLEQQLVEHQADPSGYMVEFHKVRCGAERNNNTFEVYKSLTTCH